MPKQKLFIHASFIIFLVFLSHLSFCQDIEFPAGRKGRVNLIDGTSVNFNRISIKNDTATCFLKNDIVLNYSSNKIYSLQLRKTLVLEMTLGFTGLGLTLGLLSAYALNKTAADHLKTEFIVIYTSIFAVGGFILGISLPKYKTVYVRDQARIQWQPGLLYSSHNNKLYPGLRIVLNINPN